MGSQLKKLRKRCAPPPRGQVTPLTVTLPGQPGTAPYKFVVEQAPGSLPLDVRDIEVSIGGKTFPGLAEVDHG